MHAATATSKRSELAVVYVRADCQALHNLAILQSVA
jgi:hypothetical protein